MQVPKVVVDDFEGAFRIVEHLIQQGYRRIAHLGGPLHLLVSQERLRGYVAALQKYDLPVEEELIVHSDLSMVSSRVYGNYFLDRDNRPDAIFALNDPMAIELILLAKELGIRVPDELGIAGFSNDRVSRYIDPALTTMAQPTYEMGRVAAQQLLDLMQQSSENVSTQTVLKTSLVVRRSSLRG
jgi:LacI family transcriptional regulator/LacI family repressor for deo operon, udp, cdd, tsx, nupC, and nupG